MISSFSIGTSRTRRTISRIVFASLKTGMTTHNFTDSLRQLEQVDRIPDASDGPPRAARAPGGARPGPRRRRWPHGNGNTRARGPAERPRSRPAGRARRARPRNRRRPCGTGRRRRRSRRPSGSVTPRRFSSSARRPRSRPQSTFESERIARAFSGPPANGLKYDSSCGWMRMSSPADTKGSAQRASSGRPRGRAARRRARGGRARRRPWRGADRPAAGAGCRCCSVVPIDARKSTPAGQQEERRVRARGPAAARRGPRAAAPSAAGTRSSSWPETPRRSRTESPRATTSRTGS